MKAVICKICHTFSLEQAACRTFSICLNGMELELTLGHALACGSKLGTRRSAKDDRGLVISRLQTVGCRAQRAAVLELGAHLCGGKGVNTWASVGGKFTKAAAYGAAMVQTCQTCNPLDRRRRSFRVELQAQLGRQLRIHAEAAASRLDKRHRFYSEA
jgi:hypothetical protein